MTQAVSAIHPYVSWQSVGAQRNGCAEESGTVPEVTAEPGRFGGTSTERVTACGRRPDVQLTAGSASLMLESHCQSHGEVRVAAPFFCPKAGLIEGQPDAIHFRVRHFPC